MTKKIIDNPESWPALLWKIVINPKIVISILVSVIAIFFLLRLLGYDVLPSILRKLDVEQNQTNIDVRQLIAESSSDMMYKYIEDNVDSIDEIWISGSRLDNTLSKLFTIFNSKNVKEKKFKFIINSNSSITYKMIAQRDEPQDTTKVMQQYFLSVNRIRGLMIFSSFLELKEIDFPLDERMVIINPSSLNNWKVFLKYYPYKEPAGISGSTGFYLEFEKFDSKNDNKLNYCKKKFENYLNAGKSIIVE